MQVSKGAALKVSLHESVLYVKKQEDVLSTRNTRGRPKPIVADADAMSEVAGAYSETCWL